MKEEKKYKYPCWNCKKEIDIEYQVVEPTVADEIIHTTYELFEGIIQGTIDPDTMSILCLYGSYKDTLPAEDILRDLKAMVEGHVNRKVLARVGGLTMEDMVNNIDKDDEGNAAAKELKNN